MSRFDDLQSFVDDANRTTDMGALRVLLQDVLAELGFDYFALVHHVDLKRDPDDYVRLLHYPQDWLEINVKNAYYADDPVHAASQRTGRPFLWSEVSQFIALTDRQKTILQTARATGLGEGITVPVNIPGDYSGSCSFSTKVGRAMPRDALVLSQFVGCFAFEAARRVVQMHKPLKKPLEEPSLRLSRRQLDCVILAGHGKSDRDAGQLLGISGQTVHQHIEDAKRRYNVATRQQLIVRALFDSQVTFADLINKLPDRSSLD